MPPSATSSKKPPAGMTPRVGTRLFLIDGTYLAYRSYFAFIRNPLFNSKGLNTSAAFGFTKTLLKILDEEEPERMAVIFDGPGKTFRHEQYPEYKATRERMPDEMKAQLHYLSRLVDAFGIPRHSVSGVEADDVMATLAVRAAEEEMTVYLVASDKDLMQVVSDQVLVYRPPRQAGKPTEIMGRLEVEEKYGVPPEGITDYLALLGDSSDNVPGVPGIGKVTAKKLLQSWGSLDELLQHAEHIKGKRARTGLVEHGERARMSRELVTLETEVELPFTPDDLKLQSEDQAALRELFVELEFRSLLGRVTTTHQATEVEYQVIQSEAQFQDLLRRLKEATEPFVLDLETSSLQPAEADIIGLSFSFEPGRAYYLPASGQRSLFVELDDSSFARRLEELKPLLEDPKLPVGGQNFKYDLLVLHHHGVERRQAAFDTKIESYLLDPSLRAHDLDELCLRYLNYKKIRTSQVMGSGSQRQNMRNVAMDQVARYACEDADFTLRLHQYFQPRVAQRELEDLYEQVELPLLSVLLDMELCGVSIDRAMLEELSHEMDQQLQELTRTIIELAGGTPFNLNSPQQLSEVLFDKLQLHKLKDVPRIRRTTTGFSTDQAVLDKLAPHHPIIEQILEYRSLQKLKGTYVDALPRLVSPRTGRIHASFNQTVARTGRLSSSNPNLQNIPIRTAEGRQIRKAFVPGQPDQLLLSADYSQIELRILAHLSKDEFLLDTFRRGEDVHRNTAARIFGVAPEEVSSLQRGRAKAINFGILYGMGPRRLAQDTGLTQQEAKQFIEQYFEKYPSIKGYIDASLESARTKGYTETLLGRRRLLPELSSRNRRVQSAAERIATNTPIQGSAADLIKVAMVRLHQRLKDEGLGTRMIIQVHDELVFEVPEGEREQAADIVRQEMETALDLGVPIKVDMGFGKNWLEAH